MTKDEYNEALSKTHIPSGPDWNQRYLDALRVNGLTLVRLSALAPDTEFGYYIQAPWPVAKRVPSWEPSLIVPING